MEYQELEIRTGEEGTPLQGLYRYVAPTGYGFERFSSENEGIDFCHFGLK